MSQLRIPAVYMRGGTSKGVFFLKDDLPADPAEREKVLLRVIGSPDRYAKHTDGMGGATSSTRRRVRRTTSAACPCRARCRQTSRHQFSEPPIAG